MKSLIVPAFCIFTVVVLTVILPIVCRDAIVIAGEYLLNRFGRKWFDSMLVRDIRTPVETKGPVQWEARFNSGLSGAEGNSELFNIHLGSFVNGRYGDSRFTLDGQYVFERDNGDKSKDEWYADIKYNFFYPNVSTGSARSGPSRMT